MITDKLIGLKGKNRNIFDDNYNSNKYKYVLIVKFPTEAQAKNINDNLDSINDQDNDE